MTDNEIIKALDSLHKRILRSNFAREVTENEVMAIVDALSLINRQKAEIERLDGEVEAMTKSMWPMIANVVEGQIADAMDFAKAEAIKEVFEKLEERLFVHSFKTKSEDYTQGQVDCMDFVDSKIEELKKELVGDSDG